MARKAVKLNISIEDLKLLEKWNKSEKIERRLHFRAQIIILCSQGKTNLEIAQELNISRFTVAKWRLRFYNEGIKGLYDIQRTDRKSVV